MLPMLALQVSLLHEPYVSIGMGSAGPALLATLFVLGLYWRVRDLGDLDQPAPP